MIDFKISKQNVKLGNVLNINLPALVTCPLNANCRKFCYANKGTYKFPVVQQRYADNLEFYKTQGVFKSAMRLQSQLQSSNVELVRWHSSGDIPDFDYLVMMVILAIDNPNKRFLAYTKRYDFINTYLKDRELPKNLTVIFSYDKNLDMSNPYNLPIALISDELTKCKAQIYNSTCDTCQRCWNLKQHDTMVFRKH